MSEEIKLLPCPHCGGEPDWAHKNKMTVRVFCKKCTAEVSQKRTTRVTFEFLKDATFDLWNRRAPLTVIAPPLEWGEWGDLHSIVEIKWSRCKKYKLTRIGKSLNIQAFEGDDNFNYPIIQVLISEAEAMAACQAHHQATINAALEGCKIEPFRDPQGLVDALRKIKDTLFNQGYPLNECDTNTFKDMSEDVDSALKAWEEGK